jgi:hypothetical protein
MVANELFQSNNAKKAIPLIPDEDCFRAQYSSDLAPARVMWQFANLRCFAREGTGRLTIGSVLSSMVHSQDAVRLRHGSDMSVNDWNQCEVAASAVIAQLGSLEAPERDNGGGDCDSSGGGVEKPRAQFEDPELLAMLGPPTKL